MEVPRIGLLALSSEVVWGQSPRGFDAGPRVDEFVDSRAKPRARAVDGLQLSVHVLETTLDPRLKIHSEKKKTSLSRHSLYELFGKRSQNLKLPNRDKYTCTYTN